MASATGHVAPVAGVAAIGEVPARRRRRLPVEEQLKVRLSAPFLHLECLRSQRGCEVSRSGGRLNLGIWIPAEKCVSRARQRPPQHRMIRRRGDGVVVHVEDTVFGRQIGSPKLGRRHHASSSDVVAQRLYLQGVAAKDPSPSGEDWASRLDAELADKAFIVALESDAAAQSQWVQHEVVYALKNHLGLQVISLPGSRADRECAAVPDSFRYRVGASQILGTGARRRMRAAELDRLVVLIEAAHDDALTRRRNYLLLSAMEMVRRAGWGVVAQPAWSMLAESSGRREFLRIVPRPPRPHDLRGLDVSRRQHEEGGVIPHGHLVYECADLDPALGELLTWIAADRGLSTTLMQAVATSLETP
jgi:hypothetical protein